MARISGVDLPITKRIEIGLIRRRTSGQRNHVNGNSSSENRSAPINLRRLYVGRRRRRDGTVL